MGYIEIRPARRSDLKVIAQLIRELADFERLADRRRVTVRPGPQWSNMCP